MRSREHLLKGKTIREIKWVKGQKPGEPFISANESAGNLEQRFLFSVQLH